MRILPAIAAGEGGAHCLVRGFGHPRRFLEPATGCMSVKILPGEFYATAGDEVVTTVLGSCVSACLHDPVVCVGGMNHFMLPEPAEGGDRWGGPTGRSARYGSDAMEQLVNTLLKAGAERARLQVKIFGGARVLAQMTDIGKRNIDFVRQYLRAESLTLVSEDVGGNWPRQVRFYAASGRAQVRRLQGIDDRGLADRERHYLKQLANDPITGEVELF